MRGVCTGGRRADRVEFCWRACRRWRGGFCRGMIDVYSIFPPVLLPSIAAWCMFSFFLFRVVRAHGRNSEGLFHDFVFCFEFRFQYDMYCSPPKFGKRLINDATGSQPAKAGYCWHQGLRKSVVGHFCRHLPKCLPDHRIPCGSGSC